MANKILAYIEAKDNKFRNSAFEVISEAKKLSDALGCEFDVLTISDAGSDELNNLGAYGAKKVKVAGLDALNGIYGNEIKFSHTAFAKVVSETAAGGGYNIIVLSATTFGKEISPSIAVRTDSALCPDCVDVRINDGVITATRPVYAGKS